MANDKRKIWQIEDYDDETRREIKIFAASQDTTIAKALKRIVMEWKAGSGSAAE